MGLSKMRLLEQCVGNIDECADTSSCLSGNYLMHFENSNIGAFERHSLFTAGTNLHFCEGSSELRAQANEPNQVYTMQSANELCTWRSRATHGHFAHVAPDACEEQSQYSQLTLNNALLPLGSVGCVEQYLSWGTHLRAEFLRRVIVSERSHIVTLTHFDLHTVNQVVATCANSELQTFVEKVRRLSGSQVGTRAFLYA